MVGISTGLSERPLRAKPVQPGAYKERDQEENPAPCSYPTPMQLVYKSTRQWLRPARRFPLFMLEPLRLFFLIACDSTRVTLRLAWPTKRRQGSFRYNMQDHRM